MSEHAPDNQAMRASDMPTIETIATAASEIRAGRLSPIDLTQAVLDRIADQAELDAYVTVTKDHALDRARQAEAEIAAGNYRGPLHGIPIAIKDMIHTSFAATTNGMPIFRNFTTSHDATVVTRLEDAGAVIVGKLALTEGCVGVHGAGMPRPLNPWNHQRWSGFSSSGSGVAMAAGLCLGTLGSDTGGSIRFPAAANGVTGLKPSVGRVSNYGSFPFAAALDVIGPLTRTAQDAAIMLQAIAGWDSADPATSSAPVPDYEAALAAGATGLRIGVDERFAFDGVAPELVEAIERALSELQGSGAEVRRIVMPRLDDLMGDYALTAGIDMAAGHRETWPSRADEYGPGLAAILQHYSTATPFQMIDAARRVRAFTGKLSALFNEVDLIALPVVPFLTPTHERIMEGATKGNLPLTNFTMPFNLSGHPAIAFPIGMDPEGMPMSLQLVAPMMREDFALRAAHAFQQQTRWHLLRP